MATAELVAYKQPRSITRKLIPLVRLKDAAHNPPARTLEKNLRELADSMDRIGLLHPVTVSRDWEIIDGHRRRAAARLLGWRDIECNVVEEDPAEVYASVNPTARRLSGNDALSVWLVNKNAVPRASAARFEQMAAEVGLPLAKKIAKAGMSVRVWQTARRIARYCDSAEVAAILDWLIDVATVGQVMKALESGVSAHVFLSAVRKGKPIVFRAQVAD